MTVQDCPIWYQHFLLKTLTSFAILSFDLILERTFLSQDMVIMLSEAVSLISNVLQQP